MLSVNTAVKRVQHSARPFVIAALIFTVILSVACHGGKDCPAFSDPELNAWFPYDTQHTWYFKGSNGQTDSLKFTEVTSTEAYKSGNSFSSRSCSEGATLTTGENPHYIYLNIYETDVNSKIENADIEVNGLDYFATRLSDTGYVYSNSRLGHTLYHDSLSLNGQSFTQVQEIIADSMLNNETVSRIWIAKNKGLVGFQERNNKTVFTLQN